MSIVIVSLIYTKNSFFKIVGPVDLHTTRFHSIMIQFSFVYNFDIVYFTASKSSNLEIDNEGRLRTKLYDKRNDFNFPIANFPFICSSIPAIPSYGVYISQSKRYFRACGSYQDFLDRGSLLTRKLLNQGFLLVKLKSSFRRLHVRHHDRYGISVSQMTTDMFHLP